MNKNNFETVAVSEMVGAAFHTKPATPAPYLLVVDDERVLADSLALIFRQEGYAVTVAYDAESAFEIAKLAPPQVLVTDVALPGMNGVDLAFLLQESISDCNIILVTGSPEEATRLAATRPGHGFQMFAKPVQPTELLKCISDLLACNAQQVEQPKFSGAQLRTPRREYGMILSGWKDIAKYFGRGVRTVQRWEAFGLPVVRPAGHVKSAVCAHTEELDAWLRQSCGIEQLHQRVRELAVENEMLKRQLSDTAAQPPLSQVA